MIRLNLEIADTGRHDAVQLRALSAMFLVLADGGKADQVRAALEEKTTAARSERTVGASPALAAPYGAQVIGAAAQLDPADNPEAGIPTPSEAFAGSPELDADLPPPAAAFAGGAGNVPVPVAGNPAISAPKTESLPPVPSSVPSAAGAPANVAGVELDVEGIPWDASIHASTKAKLASGAWKVKRGTPELYLKERKELLRQAVAAGGNAGAPATPPASAAVPPPAGAGAPPVPPAPSSAGNVPAPIPTPQASAQTTPGMAGSSGVVTMAQVLPRVTAAISAGLLTPDSAAAIVRELSDGKIDNVAMLAVAPQLLAPFAARLDLLGIPA